MITVNPPWLEIARMCSHLNSKVMFNFISSSFADTDSIDTKSGFYIKQIENALGVINLILIPSERRGGSSDWSVEEDYNDWSVDEDGSDWSVEEDCSDWSGEEDCSD